MNKLQIYKSERFGTIRTDVDEKGKPLFCAADITKALGYVNSSKAISMHCKEKGITKRYTLTSGGKQALTYIDEGNLYRLITHSKLPEAETFETWVFDEVLPEIRKTGGYNPEQSDAYKTKRLEIMAMNAKARIMKEQNKRLEIMLKNNELEGLSVTAIQAILNEHPQTEKTYSATEAAEMFGVSANKIGRLANAHGLKCDKYGITVLDKAKHCDKEVQSFRYNEKGIEKLKELLSEEKAVN